MATFSKLNRHYLEVRKNEPGLTYAEFRVRSVVRNIRAGKPSERLGPVMANGGDWQDAGIPTFKEAVKKFGIKPQHRLIDYGCGTFQIGVHFMRYLHPGNYFALDVTPELIEIGRDMLGADLISQRRPRLGVIRTDMNEAVSFGADIVYSCMVCRHVHPEERVSYFGNLSKLTHRPGARLIFDAVVGDDPTNQRATSLPFEKYVEALPELKLVQFHRTHGKRRKTDGRLIEIGDFEFMRDDQPVTWPRQVMRRLRLFGRRA